MVMVSWNKMSYPWRLFFWLIGYSLLLVGCFVVFQYHREKYFKSEELNARLQGINSEILSHTDSLTLPISTDYPYEELRVSIIDTTGKVIYDNSLDASTTGNHIGREEIKAARRHGSGYTVRRHSESTGRTYFYAATLGDNGYIVRTAVPYTVTLTALLEADMNFIWAMGAITLFMCILGYFATRRIGLHILRLNHFAEKAERGERIYDTAPFPQDELGSISNHIVRLYAELQQAIADRDKEHQEVVHQQQEKERIKKQLTNNINHELKTPVSSIQVCIETLLGHEELDNEKRREFLQRCMTNTERLKRLLADVSQITRLDDAPESIIKERLDLTELISNIAYDCEPLAASRGMRIINEITCPLPFHGNPSLLGSIFHNLIDNAIAYSGGTWVRLRLTDYGTGQLVIIVSDNGKGVPAEHLPHLFERFYRIDKGRSRASGGTGLGLSIVKNAVLFHNGSITVDNRNAGGLIFTIMFRETNENKTDNRFGLHMTTAKPAR